MHVKQEHNIGFFIFKFTLKYLLAVTYSEIFWTYRYNAERVLFYLKMNFI